MPSKRSASNDLSALEQRRLDNIARNEQFLSSLGLDDVKIEQEKVVKKVSQKGVFKKKDVVIPTRRSGRVTTEKLKSELDQLIKNEAGNEEIVLKRKEMEEFQAAHAKQDYEAIIESENAAVERIRDDIKLADPVNFSNDEIPTDLNSWVAKLYNHNDTKVVKKIKKEAYDYAKKTSALTLEENCVAKITENRITSVAIHPNSDKIIVFAGDKSGYFGIWDVMMEGDGSISKYKPHIANINHVYANPRNQQVYSSSYDGTIRVLDLQKEMFRLAFETPESLYDISVNDLSFCCSNDSSSKSDECVYVGLSTGKLAFIDLKESNSKYTSLYDTCFDSKIQSVQVHPTLEHYLIATSGGTNGYVGIFDIRKSMKKAVSTLNDHSKSINAAYASTNGDVLVSVSQDNTIKTYHNYMNEKPSHVSTRHDNHTGRWLSTFRPTFDKKHPTAFILGSMDRPRKIEVFIPTVDTNHKVTNTLGVELKNEFLNSVCSRNCAHPTLDIIVGGNSSGRAHVFK
jgi:WD40 repeat protein